MDTDTLLAVAERCYPEITAGRGQAVTTEGELGSLLKCSCEEAVLFAQSL